MDIESEKSKQITTKSSRRRFFLILDAVVFVLIGLVVVLLILPAGKSPPDESPAEEPASLQRRPSMNLRKPKVQRFSQPRPADRILSKITTKPLPDVRLPELMSAGEGLLGAMATLPPMRDRPAARPDSLFGSTESIGNELEATFYNFDQDRSGGIINISHSEYFVNLREFVSSGWQTGTLDRFYRSPRKLYANTVAVPLGSAIEGPLAFGEDIERCRYWAVHYRGRIIHGDGIEFRFWGTSECVLVVAVDGELALAANAPTTDLDAYTIGENWNRRAWGSRKMLSNNGPYKCGSNSLVGGQWITLEPGVPYDIDVLVGNGPASQFFAMLMIEVREKTYPLNDWGGPKFPLFALAPLSWELQDQILLNMFDGEANVTNITTYFNDF